MPATVEQLKPFQFSDPEKARQAAIKSHLPTSARHLQPNADPTEQFRFKVVTRTREQIKVILKRIDEELAKEDVNTKALRELSDTLAKFELVEQKLSGRASPGSLRPTSRKAKGERQSYAAPELDETE